jgi:hypothetical protein
VRLILFVYKLKLQLQNQSHGHKHEQIAVPLEDLCYYQSADLCTSFISSSTAVTGPWPPIWFRRNLFIHIP